MLDVDSIRREFPILSRTVHGKPLIYLDNAATTQKPLCVLDASRHYYEHTNANIHRGAHALAHHATELYEAAREIIARAFHAESPDEIIFTSGCTDAINLVAISLSRSNLIQKNDIIVLSALEHHSNIVPWQMLCDATGATLEIIPCDESGVLDQPAYQEILKKSPKIVALQWVSNAFGTVHPIAEMMQAARQAGAITLIDAAQATPHFEIDVRALHCDFLAFSGHKMYAPTGIGGLWGRREMLEKLPPFRGGGEMIAEVSFEKTTYNQLPYKYEAGTPNIEGTIALGAAFEFMNRLGKNAIAAHETQLIRAAEAALQDIDGIRFFGPSDRVGALSFEIAGIHAYDLGTLLDQMGVAVRTGHHCCQPLMARFSISGTTRASFAVYNTLEEIEHFSRAVRKASLMLR